MKQVGFFDAIKLAFQHYADFSGRATRSEDWYFFLFNTIVSTVLAAVPMVAGIWMLVALVPGLAVAIRRLHDAGKSGWYYLWLLVPIVGTILVLVQFFKDSAPDNIWGPNPKV